MSHDVRIALPTADRGTAYAFAQALGFETPGELADDGVPEPLTVVLNERTAVMYIPTGGFGWVTASRTTAPRGTVECLLSIGVASPADVDALLGLVASAGGEVAVPAEQREWGYTGTFADPDGHLWEVIATG